MNGKVLIIDDEPAIRKTMEMIHRNAGWEAVSAADGAEALDHIENNDFHIIYLDLALPGRDGIEILKDIRIRRPDQIVVILTGQATVEKAVSATRLGAFDFLEKDCGKEKILLTSRNALGLRNLTEENRRLKSRVPGRQEFLGRSEDFTGILQAIAKVAPTGARVLILGESGTGKELIAREIHERSNRSDKPFIKVNCAAIPEDLIEAELFGSVKGAYTGSVSSRKGRFQAADGGTIFLDETGDMSLRVQTKVLRALQEGEIEMVGSDGAIKVDVRVLAATNKNLEQEVTRGAFREDLFYRLNVVPIYSPPLRSHPEDIPLLAGSFLKAYCSENELPIKKFSEKVLDMMKKYYWPGNVRELRNQVERMAIMSKNPEIQPSDLSPEIFTRRIVGQKTGADFRAADDRPLDSANAGQHDQTSLADYPVDNTVGLERFEGRPIQEARRIFEKEIIERALDRNNWNVTRASEELGLERTNLHKKMKQLDLSRKDV